MKPHVDSCKMCVTADDCGQAVLLDGGRPWPEGQKEGTHNFKAEVSVFDAETLRFVSRSGSKSVTAGGQQGLPLYAVHESRSQSASKHWSCHSSDRKSSSSTIGSDMDSSKSDSCYEVSQRAISARRLRERKQPLCVLSERGAPHANSAGSRAGDSNLSSDVSDVVKSSGISNTSGTNESTTGDKNIRNSSCDGDSSTSSSELVCTSFLDIVLAYAEGEILLTIEEHPWTGTKETIPLKHIFHLDTNLVLCCSSRRNDTSPVATPLLQARTSSSSSSVVYAVAASGKEEAVPSPWTEGSAGVGKAAALAGVGASCESIVASPAISSPPGPVVAGGSDSRGPAAAGAAADLVVEDADRNRIFTCSASQDSTERSAFCTTEKLFFALRFANARDAESFVMQVSTYATLGKNSTISCSCGFCGHTDFQGFNSTAEQDANARNVGVVSDAVAESDSAANAASLVRWDSATDDGHPVDCSADLLKNDKVDMQRRPRFLRRSQRQQEVSEKQQTGQGRLQRLLHQQFSREQQQRQQSGQQQKTRWWPTRRLQDQQRSLPRDRGKQQNRNEQESVHAQGTAAGATAATTPLQQMDAGTVEGYFSYYGKLSSQMNIMQDTIRTAAYYRAITSNKVDFEGKVVMDVGAGSGILSFFAAQAGAKKVYAVEASTSAATIDLLRLKNPGIGQRIVVLNACIEALDIKDVPEKVDVLVSEPLGTLLFNERMIETYLIARDRFLKPNGKMYPSRCALAVAPFTDAAVYNEYLSRVELWRHQRFYGVDLTAAHANAKAESFKQPTIDLIDPASLVASPKYRMFDWRTLSVDELKDIYLPLQYVLPTAAVIHGLAGWFDVIFDGSAASSTFSTSPFAPSTHWYQTRIVFTKPLAANERQRVKGYLRLVANNQQSYHIFASLRLKDSDITVSAMEVDLKDPIYRFFTNSSPSYNYAAYQQGTNPTVNRIGASTLEDSSIPCSVCGFGADTTSLSRRTRRGKASEASPTAQ